MPSRILSSTKVAKILFKQFFNIYVIEYVSIFCNFGKKVIMRKVIFLLCCFFCVTATAQTFEISISGKEKWEIKVSLGNVLRYYMYEEDIPSSIPGLYDKIEW